jgi:Cellulase (glycosyl hydrolase family 5)
MGYFEGWFFLHICIGSVMRRMKIALLVLLLFPLSSSLFAATQRWSVEKANAWYRQTPWLVGSNFIPASAINQLEMWQANTFDPQEIDTELAWADAIGMNTMRVFLHDLLWEQDPSGFRERVNTFLTIAAKHHIRPIFVLFDSCWNPFPKLGPQYAPTPGVHNSGWVQSPGKIALEDSAQYPRLKTYVAGIVGAFADDSRIMAWDLWNEPDNMNQRSYGKVEPKNKMELVLKLLPQVFEWARSAVPSQPLTSGIWSGDWSSLESLSPIQRVQLEQSDVISFHNYSWPEDFEKRVDELERYHRPILCTEFMARPMGSTFDAILPIAKRHHVAGINWGLVAGKTQTYLPWDSWQRPYVVEEPPVWFHEVFHPDGHPYREREIAIIRELSGKSAPVPDEASIH